MKLTKRLLTENYEWLIGITKMRQRIFVLCQWHSPERRQPFIHVFQDEAPFQRIDNIEISEIKESNDIVSNEAKNCLYVSDRKSTQLWMIREEVGEVVYLRNTESLRDGDFKQTRWIIQQTPVRLRWPFTLSISNDGSLLVPESSFRGSYINIYTPDLDLHKSFKLPPEMSVPIHAVATSRGTILVLHRMSSKINGAENGTFDSPAEEFNVLVKYTRKTHTYAVSEFSYDGQFLGGLGKPQNQEQEFRNPLYLTLDSDDRVFVAEAETFRVVLLDSYLGWGQNIAETRQSGYRHSVLREPFRLHFDKEKKQLIIIDRNRSYSIRPAVVYSLIQK